MPEVDTHGGQEHAIDARSLVHHLVMTMIAVTVIADHRVRDVVEVAANLMPSTGNRLDFKQRVSTGGKSIRLPWHLESPQTLKFGFGFLIGILVCAAGIPFLPELVLQRSIDDERIVGITSNEGLVVFRNLPICKSLDHPGCSFTMKPEQNDTRSRAIQSMDWIDKLADLIPQSLQEDRFMRQRHFAAVHNQTRRLEHRDEMLVSIKNLKRPRQRLTDEVIRFLQGERCRLLLFLLLCFLGLSDQRLAIGALQVSG